MIPGKNIHRLRSKVAHMLRCGSTAVGPLDDRMDGSLALATSQASPSASLIAEFTLILRNFLVRMNYHAPDTQVNDKLRSEVAAQILSWNHVLGPAFVQDTIDTSCTMAESAYGHTSYDHQFLIATYTTFLAYIEDLGEHNVEALGKVVRWCVTREDLQDPILEGMLLQFRDMYNYYPRFGAEAINTSTLGAMLGMHIECVSKDMVIAPRATMYPGFLRLRTGAGIGFALFNFVKDWRDPADSYYLQLIP